jgi:hypothetical protein
MTLAYVGPPGVSGNFQKASIFSINYETQNLAGPEKLAAGRPSQPLFARPG